MQTKVSWYDSNSTGWWRDINILMHWPYSIWFMSYVVIGASLVDKINMTALGWTSMAFFLAMPIGCHALDEIHGRPLKTEIPDWVLFPLAFLSIGGAIAIGAVIGIEKTGWIIPCMIFGGFISFAYNLELWFFHRDEWFAISWGAFPVLVSYLAQEYTLRWEAIAVAAGCFSLSLAQRTLSKQARFWRRKVSFLDAHYFINGNELSHMLKQEEVTLPAEISLRWMTLATVAAAIGLLIGGL